LQRLGRANFYPGTTIKLRQARAVRQTTPESHRSLVSTHRTNRRDGWGRSFAPSGTTTVELTRLLPHFAWI